MIANNFQEFTQTLIRNKGLLRRNPTVMQGRRPWERRGSVRGFTLMELIVYFGIFSILLLILTNVFSNSISSQLESESLTNVEQDGRFLLLRFAQDITRSDSITTPASPGNSASTLIIVIDGDTYTYTANGGNLYLTRNSGTYRLNNFGTTIEDLNFTRIGNTNGKNTITVSLTIRSLTLVNNIQETKSFNTSIGTR